MYIVRMQRRTNIIGGELGNWDDSRFWSSLEKVRQYLQECGYEHKFSDKITENSLLSDYENWFAPIDENSAFAILFKDKTQDEIRLSVYQLDDLIK